LLASTPIFAATPAATVVCSPGNPTTELAAKVKSGSIVQVLAYEFISGHLWTSEDGIERKLIKPAKMGGTATIQFLIDTGNQQTPSKAYSFILKRPWEPNAVSTCKVTVLKK
jgi:hypothetical protein